MSGISKKRYRKPAEQGRWHFGRGGIPKAITDELGLAFTEWSFVEQQMDALLSVAIGKPSIAKVLRNNVRTSKQRRAILSDLAASEGAENLRAVVTAMLAEFTPLAAERALYAHGLWGVHEAHPEEAILLLDDSFVSAMHPELPPFASPPEPFLDRIRENTALVSLRDLTRFRAAMKRLRDKLGPLIPELQVQQQMAKLANRQFGGG